MITNAETSTAPAKKKRLERRHWEITGFRIKFATTDTRSSSSATPGPPWGNIEKSRCTGDQRSGSLGRPKPAFGYGRDPSIEGPQKWLHPLELQLQRQLNRSGAADLIERIEAAEPAGRPQAARQGLCGAAEQRTAQVPVRRAEVRVIEDVEHLRAEEQSDRRAHMEPPLHSHVRLIRAEASQHVAPEIPLLPRGRSRECRSVENLASGILVPEELERHAGVEVGTVTDGGARAKGNGTEDADGRRRSSVDE